MYPTLAVEIQVPERRLLIRGEGEHGEHGGPERVDPDLSNIHFLNEFLGFESRFREKSCSLAIWVSRRGYGVREKESLLIDDLYRLVECVNVHDL